MHNKNNNNDNNNNSMDFKDEMIFKWVDALSNKKITLRSGNKHHNLAANNTTFVYNKMCSASLFKMMLVNNSWNEIRQC